MRKFKKVLLMTLMICSLYAMTACGNTNGNGNGEKPKEPTAQEGAAA